MCAQTSSKEDSSAAVITPRMPWRVAAVEALQGFKLRVKFLDGTEGTVEMKELIHSPDAGVFAELSNPVHFEQVYLEHGAVTWPGEIDLAPDAMYRAIKESGVWRLA